MDSRKSLSIKWVIQHGYEKNENTIDEWHKTISTKLVRIMFSNNHNIWNSYSFNTYPSILSF